ncbi:hypothetical protein EDD86DRAFT_132206 [Gorgonomyces haynaldii]|nr:hypothetical protein EDD86DRAFT_132206 [Gorgonomyces haynaldii]
MRDGILFHGHSNPPQPQYPPMSAVFQDSQEFHELSMARFGAFMPHGSILKSSLFLVMKEWSFFASTWNLLLEGCQLSDYSRLARDQMCAVKRGTCTFLQKAILAQSSGCSGLIVLSKSKDSLSMTSAIKSNDPIEIPLFYATLEGSLALLKRNKQPITLLAVEQELMNPTLFASTSMAFQGLVVKNVQFVTRTTQDQKRDSNHYKTGWMHTGQRLECFQQSFSKNRCC